jgi:hypothetical protein
LSRGQGRARVLPDHLPDDARERVPDVYSR